jgi:hypothetical protein
MNRIPAESGKDRLRLFLPLTGLLFARSYPGWVEGKRHTP